ncbi:biotin--[acetyl-CoA-carboxylase] ligase [Mycolicibacterium confluentis]|uniref:Biotin--[acetyl-CoA-carboxylase] ligase n=1 Tax=Mycolicibacterium confluentis TaxID=28047 RepID=A0A7I7XZV4_9MYCO|nr:biotin--[acetyl-CoA-carboxylase] ligase [Mycolicibacterium confluentis]MCV7319829.1 biotin--[acetyl-CoA-carboxylase] ligase [Mycolicibacterium confluentis]ORV34409.1 biotin--acetyl-CoA-carboxylase ligase [Mycolicibacterium confluentis]BBZ34859.1 biotin--[acetyl-CoA-carboxylase] ligase [Mycolicibacterium confluentis]
MNHDALRPPVDTELIRRTALQPAGPWRRFNVVTETGSTNADLLARARSGEDIAGAVLAADHQTAGRGRNGRQWSAPPRSQVAVSVGVDVSGVPSSAWGLLPLATGVSVIDAVAAVTGLEAKLKWPNDVLAETGKLAGVLAEVASPAPVVVIGTGINVSLTADELPDPVATSLTMLGAGPVDRTALLAGYLTALARRVQQWRVADPDLLADYRQRSATLGTAVKVLLPGDRQLVGQAVDIDDFGRLLIDADGEQVTVAAGDVTHLRPAQ